MKMADTRDLTEHMSSADGLEILLILAGAVILAVGSYFYLYPEKVKMVGRGFFRSKKQRDTIIAGSRNPGIIIRYDINSIKQSQIIKNMITYLENQTEGAPFTEGNAGTQYTIPFVPADDESNPDLSLEEEGPEVREEDEPVQDNAHVQLGDLIKSEKK